MLLNISIYKKKTVNDSNISFDSVETGQEGEFRDNKISV